MFALNAQGDEEVHGSKHSWTTQLTALFACDTCRELYKKHSHWYSFACRSKCFPCHAAACLFIVHHHSSESPLQSWHHYFYRKPHTFAALTHHRDPGTTNPPHTFATLTRHAAACPTVLHCRLRGLVAGLGLQQKTVGRADVDV